ncbi:MAG: hypothetical protein ABW168_16575 [Sedimenticola sp.]
MKVCVGINDLLNKTRHKFGSELELANISLDAIFDCFRHFKQSVKLQRPNTLFAFITIPHFSFLGYRDFSIANKKLSRSKFTEDELKKFQITLNEKINEINDFLINENVTDNSELGRPLSVLWHKEIRHQHTHRSGRCRKKRTLVYSYHFSRLYDGLHAKSHIKRKWFRSFCFVFEKETINAQSLADEHLSDSSGFSDTISVSDTESESEPLYQCWKRQKVE